MADRDILHDLLSVINRSAKPSKQDERPQKRPREDLADVLSDTTSTESASISVHSHDNRNGNGLGHQPLECLPGARICPDVNYASSVEPSSFPQSAFDFALPVHSEELGRLPVWQHPDACMASEPETYGFTWSTSSNDTQSGGQYPVFDSSTFLGADPSQPGFDPELEAIFAGVLPDASFSDPYASLTHVGAGYLNEWPSGSARSMGVD